MSKYEYKCMTCDHIYWFEHPQSYRNCNKCEWKGEIRLKSIQHDDFEPKDEDPVYDDGAGNVDYPEIDADAELQMIKTELIAEQKRAEDEEPEMPEGGWECSECGAPVNNMNDVCSQSCFNAMMR